MFASCSGVEGCASGSASAAATTSPSVIASKCSQSVAPVGRGSPDLTVTRVIPVLLMTFSFPRRNDVTKVFITHRHDDEENAPLGHPYHLKSLLAISEARIDILKPIRIFECADGIAEVDAVITKIRGCLAVVPFVLHRGTLPRTGILGRAMD